MKKRFFAYSFVMTLMLLGAMYGHLHTGFSDMSTSDLIRILFGGGNDVEKLTVFDFRLVRTILAVFIGMGLAMSGAIFQTISRNELASPSLLGVNAGAGLGVFAAAKSIVETNPDRKVWVIGVDQDQQAEGKVNDSRNVTLTSTLKGVKQALMKFTDDAAKGNYHGGEQVV